MDQNQRLELVNETLTEAVQELMIYRRLVQALCDGAKIEPEELDLIILPLRSDVIAIREIRDAWHVYLETLLASGGMFPHTLLLNFCHEWTLPNRREMN